MKTRRKNLGSRWFSLLLALVTILGLAVATVSAQPGIDPQSVEKVVYPGEQVLIAKNVTTPVFPPQPVVVFLADTTGSMGPAIANVKAGAITVMNTVLAAQPTAKFAAAQYRDVGDGPLLFAVGQDTTADILAVQTAINGWSAGGGGDVPEAQLNALYQIATGAVTFPPDSTPIIAWFGDASGHDPSAGITEAMAITALQNAGIKVIAINVQSGFGDGLDATGQATLITAATGGIYLGDVGEDAVAAAILVGLQNLTIDVAMASNAMPPLSTTFAPLAYFGVMSGSTVSFDETIAVAAGAAGGTYSAQDWALINGQPMTDEAGEVIYEQKTIHVPGIALQPASDTNELMPGAEHTVIATVIAGDHGPLSGVRVEFEILSGPNAGRTYVGATNVSGQVAWTYAAEQGPSGLGTDTVEASFTNADGSVVYGTDQATKKWQDMTPPDAECLEGVNPSGKQTPRAPGRGGQGQNQDGFYELRAHDAVWPHDALRIYVIDAGSGTVFGPYDVGTVVKYTQARGAPPSAKLIGSQMGQAGAVEVHITGRGDATIYAVDGSGNTSVPLYCLVPPPPK